MKNLGMIDTVSGAYVEVALIATGAISNSMIATLEDAEVSVVVVVFVVVVAAVVVLVVVVSVESDFIKFNSIAGGAAALLGGVGDRHVRGHEDHHRDVRRLLPRSPRVAVRVLLRQAGQSLLREVCQGMYYVCAHHMHDWGGNKGLGMGGSEVLTV